MPESRLAKTRRSLPEGYQFGDAGSFRHQWWCGGHNPCACSPGWLAGGWRGERVRVPEPPGDYVAWKVYKDIEQRGALSAITLPLSGPGADYRDQHAVAVAESFVKNNPTAKKPDVLFRLGVDTCRTCGTTGQYDCPDCGCWILKAFTTDRSKCPRCHADAYVTPGGMWHCGPCAIGWEQA